MICFVVWVVTVCYILDCYIFLMSKSDAIELLKSDAVKNKFNDMLKDQSWSFLTTVMSIIGSNDMLKDADPNSVFMAAITAAGMKLPINPNLGFAYIVPYKKKDWPVMAQFQMWYKWFIQLALRSNRFKHISATPIYEWQLTGNNPLTGYVFDFDIAPKWDPIWYAAYFQLHDWFEKTMYMTVDELKKHGAKFSQSYKKWYGLWKDDFDSMAQKTVLKLLLSKYAPMSVDMQKALIADQWVINDEDMLEIDYVDNDQQEIINQDVEDKMKEMTLPVDEKTDAK